MKTTDIFLPPGVQARLFERLGHSPRTGTVLQAAAIDLLWRDRNKADENEIDVIDSGMLKVMLGES